MHILWESLWLKASCGWGLNFLSVLPRIALKCRDYGMVDPYVCTAVLLISMRGDEHSSEDKSCVERALFHSVC